MSHHRITWTIEDDTVVGRVSCSAPIDANCRLVCPEGCESWPCGHDLHHGRCNAVEWFDAEGGGCITEFHVGEGRVSLRDGPVEVSRDGDRYVWEYAAPGCADCPADCISCTRDASDLPRIRVHNDGRLAMPRELVDPARRGWWAIISSDQHVTSVGIASTVEVYLPGWRDAVIVPLPAPDEIHEFASLNFPAGALPIGEPA